MSSSYTMHEYLPGRRGINQVFLHTPMLVLLTKKYIISRISLRDRLQFVLPLRSVYWKQWVLPLVERYVAHPFLLQRTTTLGLPLRCLRVIAFIWPLHLWQVCSSWGLTMCAEKTGYLLIVERYLLEVIFNIKNLWIQKCSGYITDVSNSKLNVTIRYTA